MNQKQRNVLVAVLLAVVLMAAYPPFHFHGQNGVVVNLGYAWLIDPPRWGNAAATVDITMLLTQWFGVAIVGAIGLLLMKDP